MGAGSGIRGVNLEKELAVAGEAARAAGALLVKLYGQDIHVLKKGRIDLVTDADLGAENLIIDFLRRHFQGDRIVAEESGVHNAGSDRVWLIDPLDGTTNYAHGFPFFAISIALEIEDRVCLGVIYSPALNEYFEVVRGGGARLNGKPICVSDTSELAEALLGTGFPYNLQDNFALHVQRFARVLLKVQGVRRPGAAAIDLAYVAAGRFDGFWEVGLKPWDTAAGQLMVEEAGGRVTTLRGDPFSPYSESVLAANPALHSALLEVLNEKG